MNLHIGDIVRYLNDVGGGVVKEIVGSSEVRILDESGFLLVVKVSDLVLVERCQDANTAEFDGKQDDVMKEEDNDIPGNDIPHLYIAFVRNKRKSDVFAMYLINDSNYHFPYVVYSGESTASRISSGILEANTKVQLSEISYSMLTDFTEIHIQGVFFKYSDYEPQKPVDCTIHVQPVKFYKPGVFVVNVFFDEDAYIIDFYDASKLRFEEELSQLRSVEPEKIRDALLEKESAEEKPRTMTKKDSSIREIDLHIDSLIDDSSSMTPFEKLNYQMKAFEDELIRAVKDGIEKIVFIHGVGEGVLKAKIRGCLDKDYPQYYYQDASFEKYKFGATLVYLRKIYK